jgi:hypothetical protein
MPAVDIELLISADEFTKRYCTPNAVVIARASDGRSVRFPASALQRFVTRAGIAGRFRIHFDERGKLGAVERLATR